MVIRKFRSVPRDTEALDIENASSIYNCVVSPRKFRKASTRTALPKKYTLHI